MVWLEIALEQLFEYFYQYMVNNLITRDKSKTVNKSIDSNISNSYDVTATKSNLNQDVDQESFIVEKINTKKEDSLYQSTPIQVCYMDPVQKRISKYDMTVEQCMKVADVKQLLHNQLNDKVEHWSNLAILFMGKELPDGLEISGCDLGDHSLLHAFDVHKVKSNKASGTSQSSEKTISILTELPSKLTQINKPAVSGEGPNSELIEANALPDESVSRHHEGKLYFFVYCQVCKALRNGKLRVICTKCSQGSILFEQEPQNWTDLLASSGIECKCFTPNCDGTRARFYFKCINELQHPHEIVATNDMNSVAPLNRLRRNNIHATCLACMDCHFRIVLVFGCGHVICLDCFRDYCKICLSERNLAWIETFGYTVNCPMDCADSWIENTHMLLLESRLYSLYVKFSTEESILQQGGLLCPHSDCDQAYYPQKMPPTVCEVVECDKCKLIYCFLCTYQGQYAALHCDFESLIDKTNSEIKQRLQSEYSSEPSASSYIGNLIAKFNKLRQIASGLSGSDNSHNDVPRWQDTMSRLKILEIAKPCPKCRTPTERNGGCMHMVCTRKRCNYNWCWLCLTEWNTDCMSTHWFG